MDEIAADRILLNGRILNPDGGPRATALAVAGGRVAAVGGRELLDLLEPLEQPRGARAAACLFVRLQAEELVGGHSQGGGEVDQEGTWRLSVLLLVVRDDPFGDADRLGDLLSGLSSKAGSFTVLPIQPYADEVAKRVIITAKRLGKAPLKLLPALILHERSERKHTDAVEAILRGEANL